MPLAVLLPAMLAFVLSGSPQGGQSVLLEIRVFDGPEEVTGQTRVVVHAAGDRSQAVVESPTGTAPIELRVAEGIYDAQAIQERDGQVVNIQWANRLVVMKYPDEGGRHLEVLNFRSGFGALQIRAPDGSPPAVTLHASGQRETAAGPVTGPGYALFVVPAGIYAVTVKREGQPIRHDGIEVPRDRTRLWILPAAK
jgi:hypothetical protein